MYVTCACYFLSPLVVGSHAYVNAAFTLGVTNSGGSITVTSARVTFGGVGAALFRATNTEGALAGRVINQATLVRLSAAGSTHLHLLAPLFS
jgi:xanthine dehydrogenase iron-sulfur cluster and FAD-binding subunit A